MKKLHGEMLREALRQNLKKFRKEAHFSQEQIAQQLGVNRATYTYLLRNRENHPQRGGFIPALPAVRPRHGGVFPVTHPTAKEGLPHPRQPFSVYGRSLFMGGNRPQRRGRWPLSAGFLFSRCAAYKVVRLCLTNRKPFVKRLLRPSGTLPNSRPSRQTRRAKTLR